MTVKARKRPVYLVYQPTGHMVVGDNGELAEAIIIIDTCLNSRSADDVKSRNPGSKVAKRFMSEI